MTQSFRLGLFILATLAIVCSGVFLVGRQQLRFGANYRVNSEFQTVSGLNEGADVRVGGIHKGTVKSIRLPKSPDGKIVVSMDLVKETQAILKTDSVASIQSEGLLGDKYVEVAFGSAEAESLKGGETIESTPPLDVADLFRKADQILTTGQSAMENIESTTDNLNMITAKVNSGQGTAGKLVNDSTLYKEASAGMTSMRENADAMKRNFLLRGFFKDRGYSSVEEVKQNRIAEVPKDTPGKVFTFEPKDLFDKAGSAKLKNTKPLNPVGQWLQEHKFASVIIVTSSSMKGDSAKEQALTDARSYVVRKHLVDNYSLDDTRMKTLGRGKNPDAGPDGRVEILIFEEKSTQAAKAAPKKTAPTAKP